MMAYQSARWAVGGFSEALAAEVTPLGINITILEPGGMRTDSAGSSMTTPPISEPYQATVGASARAMQRFDRTANGDPAKVARLVLTLDESGPDSSVPRAIGLISEARAAQKRGRARGKLPSCPRHARVSRPPAPRPMARTARRHCAGR